MLSCANLKSLVTLLLSQWKLVFILLINVFTLQAIAAPSDRWDVEFWGGHFEVPNAATEHYRDSYSTDGVRYGTPTLYGTGQTPVSLSYTFSDTNIDHTSSNPSENPWLILVDTLANANVNPATGEYPNTNRTGVYSYIFKREAPSKGLITLGKANDYFDDYAELFVNGVLVGSINRWTPNLPQSQVINYPVEKNDEIEFRLTNRGNRGGFTVTVVFEPASVIAVDNPTVTIPAGSAGNNVTNVFDDDTLDEAAVDQTTVTLESTAIDSVLTLNPDGSVDVDPSASPGTYTLTYTICDRNELENCDSASATVIVESIVTSVTATIEPVGTPPAVCTTTSVHQLDPVSYATAIGAGASGVPSLTYTAPAGYSRMMFVLLAIERDHTPVSDGRGDNFAASQTFYGAGNLNDMPTISYGGVNLQKWAFNNQYSYGTTENAANGELSREFHAYVLWDSSIPSGSNTFTLTDNFAVPLNAGDEAVLYATTFGNVQNFEWIGQSHDIDSPFSLSLAANPASSGTQPAGTSTSDNLLLAWGQASDAGSLSIGSDWTTAAQVRIQNTAGTYIGDPARSAQPFSENDGMTSLIQSIGNVTTAQTASISSASTDLFAMGLQASRLVARACPEIIANDDDFTDTAYGSSGGTTASVIALDTLNGSAAVIGNASGQVSINTTTTGSDGTPNTLGVLTNPPASGGISMNSAGQLVIEENTTPGTYNYTYEICEVGNQSNCDTAVATVDVAPPETDIVTVSIGNVTVNESIGSASVPVSIDTASMVDTVVNITTTTGTAGTSDYTETTTIVTIPAGETSVNVSIPITDDTTDEPNETFTVNGNVTSGNTSNTDPSGIVTITDNDDPITIPQPYVNPCTVSTGLDTDGDGVNDACDLDDDNDGILNQHECVPGVVTTTEDWSAGPYDIFYNVVGDTGNATSTAGYATAASTAGVSMIYHDNWTKSGNVFTSDSGAVQVTLSGTALRDSWVATNSSPGQLSGTTGEAVAVRLLKPNANREFTGNINFTTPVTYAGFELNDFGDDGGPSDFEYEILFYVNGQFIGQIERSENYIENTTGTSNILNASGNVINLETFGTK